MKKALSYSFLFLVLTSLAGITFAASVKIFNDVTKDKWYGEAVENLASKNILQGYDDGSFKPENKVNRAELAVTIDRLLEYVETGSVTIAEKRYTSEQLATQGLFDGCLGLSGYSSEDYYDALMSKLSENHVYPTRAENDEDYYVKDVCYSAEAKKVIMLSSTAGEESGYDFIVSDYDIQEDTLTVSEKAHNSALTDLEFGLRNGEIANIAGRGCLLLYAGDLDVEENIKDMCTEVGFSYNLQTGEIIKLYQRRTDPTAAEIDAERERRTN